jgi:hypothetical protein
MLPRVIDEVSAKPAAPSPANTPTTLGPKGVMG